MCGGVGNYEGENDEVLNQIIREKKIDNLTKIIGDRLKEMDGGQADVTITFLTEFAKKLYETEGIDDGK